MTKQQQLTPEQAEREKAVLIAMRDYPLEPGQMLLLGPLSVAYLGGDYEKAPWLMPHVKAPNGKRLPDKFVLERAEWEGSAIKANEHGRNSKR